MKNNLLRAHFYKNLKKLVKKNPLVGIIYLFTLFLMSIIPVLILELENNEKDLDKEVTTHIVSRVIDGDTVEITNQNEKFTVRLIGVDTPETVSPRSEMECFGTAASNFTKTTLLSQKVKLVADETQGDTDRYGRLLRYIYINEELFNAQLIKHGFANEYTYKVPYRFQKEFQQLEQKARELSLGIWGEECKK